MFACQVGVKATYRRLWKIFEDGYELPSVDGNMKDAHVMQHTTASASSSRVVSEVAHTQAACAPACTSGEERRARDCAHGKQLASCGKQAGRARESGKGQAGTLQREVICTCGRSPSRQRQTPRKDGAATGREGTEDEGGTGGVIHDSRRERRATGKEIAGCIDRNIGNY